MASKSQMFRGGQQHIGSGANFFNETAKVNVHQQFNITNDKGFRSAAFKLQNHVVPTALHDSGEISDPPKCHPGTRVDVLTVLVTWALAAVYAYPIRWLNGPAGAGKSAIMRSFAEMLVEKGLLLATFFFFRSDGRRNNAEYLISTIAYQLCINVPSLQPWVESAVESNPLIFNASLALQIHKLIINPLLHYFYDPNSTTITPFPRIIIIDGLDECAGHGRQEEILDMLCRMVQTLPIPIAIVVASRPEHQIRSAFELGSLSKASSHIVLDDSFNPDEDIRHYYVTEFEKIRTSHSMRSYLGTTWPSQDILQILIRNASGQFIYASTVVKFVRSNRHNPALRLQIILGLADRGTSKPFQQLDNLYTVIFLNVDPEILLDTLRVLGIFLTPPINGKSEFQSPKFLESLLGFPPGIGHVRSLLLDLESLLTVTEDGKSIRIYHTSLSDFLFDKSRAGEFFIDRGLVYEDIALLCIQHFCRPPLTTNSGLSHPLLGLYLEVQLRVSLGKATPTDRLRHSIVSCGMNQLIRFQQRNGVGISRLAPLFLVGIRESHFPNAEGLYQIKLASFSETIGPKLVRHWLGSAIHKWPNLHIGPPALLFILLLAQTSANPKRAKHLVKYFPVMQNITISILPGVSYSNLDEEGPDEEGDTAFRTPEDWYLLSCLILAVINGSRGLLHTQDGREACTHLTLDIVRESLRHRMWMFEPSEALEAILPLLLDVSLVRSDLVLAVQTARRTGTGDNPGPMSGIVAAAIDSYIQRSGLDLEVIEQEATDQEVTEEEATEHGGTKRGTEQEGTEQEVTEQETKDMEATAGEVIDLEAKGLEVADREVTTREAAAKGRRISLTQIREEMVYYARGIVR